MELFEAIEKRHSYRGSFTNEEIKREDLEKIVTAGLMAPSGHNAQSTSFVILDTPEMIAKISAIFSSPVPVIANAKAIIVCIFDTDAVVNGYGKEDCAAAVENMLLAITAMGYATVWLDGILRAEQRTEKIAHLLQVPEAKQVQVILPLGVPAETVTQPEKKPFSERAWFNSYGG